MDYFGRRILVNDIDAMMNFYINALNAEILDITDTSAFLAVEDDVVEFVLGVSPVAQTAIAVQYTSEESFKDACDSLLSYQDISVRLFRRKDASTYKAELTDVEGNIVQLYHHQLFIPVH